MEQPHNDGLNSLHFDRDGLSGCEKSVMTVGDDTLFERFIAPVARLLMNPDEIKRAYAGLDWPMALRRLSDPNLAYPPYYSSQNFHGVAGGYLTVDAAMTYDPITQYALPPNETWVRQGLLDAIQGYPRRILDLGCGTGTTTLMLKQAFSDVEVVGLDLSPYMLAIAEYKAQRAGLPIRWQHGKAEQTGFADGSFDLVTVALLFHETPPAVTQAILRECYRLLKVGGEVVILDGSQRLLRQADWLTQIFEEPYIRPYAAGSLDAWLGAAGFGAVQTQEVWWLHQVTRGVKPRPGQFTSTELFADLEPVGNWATGVSS